MKIILPEAIEKKLISSLRKAGNLEIGGILMGEHISESTFLVKEITIQKHHGTSVSFVRSIANILVPLKHFFKKTDYNYTKYNYLGEWHSHPQFLIEPSSTDSQTMRDIVEDSEVGANFVILMIVRLDERKELEGTVTVYLPKREAYRGQLVQKIV